MQSFKQHSKPMKGQFDVMKNAGVGIVGLFIVLAIGGLVLATIQANLPALGASGGVNLNASAITIITQGVTNLQLMSSLAVVIVIVVIAVIIIGFFERKNGL